MKSAATNGQHTDTCEIGPFTSVIFGLRVIVGQFNWLFLNSIRGFEIRQLNKRLEQEFLWLGRLVARNAENSGLENTGTLFEPDAASTTALNQIAFLRKEIVYLEDDRKNMRREFFERFKKKCGMPDAATQGKEHK